MDKHEALKQYIRNAIESFKNDPPENDFQRGYLAALECLLREAPELVEWDDNEPERKH